MGQQHVRYDIGAIQCSLGRIPFDSFLLKLSHYEGYTPITGISEFP